MLNKRIEALEKKFKISDNVVLKVLLNCSANELETIPYPQLAEKYKDAPLLEREKGWTKHQYEWEQRRGATALLWFGRFKGVSQNIKDEYFQKFELVPALGMMHGYETAMSLDNYQRNKRGIKRF